MLKKTTIIACLGLAILLASCGSSSTESTDNKGTVTTGEKKDPAKPAGARYNFKSGIITYKATVLMMDQEIVTYFDDWGQKLRSEIDIKFMGQKGKNITITTPEFVYTWDPDKKTGSKVKFDANTPDNMNFDALTEEQKKNFQIKEEGTDKVCGRDCKVYSMTYAAAGLTGKYYVWNGIALKTDAQASGLGIVMEAIKIEENAVIPAEKFNVPTGINFKEEKSMQDAANIKI